MKISWPKILNQDRRRFLAERWLVVATSSTIVVLVATAWALHYGIPPRTEPITLHYTTSFGVDLIGPRNRMFIIPAFGALVFLVNTILALVVLRRERVVSYFLVFASFVLALFLVFAEWTLILQNR